MELFGIAIAVVPKKGAGYSRRLVCTPLAVSSDNIYTTGVLKDLAFTHDFSSVNELAACLSRLVETGEKVAKMQEDACDHAKIERRPLSLIIGQDSRNPAGLDTIYRGLFGADFSTHPDMAFTHSLEDIREREKFVDASQRMAKLIKKCALKKGDFTGGGPLSIEHALRGSR